MKWLWTLPQRSSGDSLADYKNIQESGDESVELPDAEDIVETHLCFAAAAACTVVYAILLDHSPVRIIQRIPDQAFGFTHFSMRGRLDG